MNYKKAKEEISELMRKNPNGPFTHNIVALTLQSLAKTEGNDKADQLIQELELPYYDSKGE